MNKCVGCGAILQTNDENQAGYINEDKINKTNLCMRCFRIIHYNDLKYIELDYQDKVLDEVNKKSKFSLFLLDFLNINKEVITTYKNIKSPKCLVINKTDFIPKYIKKNNLKEWLKTEYEINDSIIFLSALKNFNIKAIYDILEENNIMEAYLLGYANSGKSTLVNRLSESAITTSLMPNTTLDFIKIKLEDRKYLIDSPGFLYSNNWLIKNLSLLKKVSPKNTIRPITHQLKNNASIIIEDFIRIENLNSKCNLTFYISNLLNMKKVYDKNGFLKESKKIILDIKNNQDLVLKGIGFINFKSSVRLNIYTNIEDFIEIRDSFLRGSGYE